MITLNDLRKAQTIQDPDLPQILLELMDAQPPQTTTPRKGALTLKDFVSTINSYNYSKKTLEQKKNYRIETMKALEAEDAEVPLPERMKVHAVLLDLWEKNGSYERECLFRIIESVPLKLGPWKALKKIFKEAEQKNDSEMLGALAARFDTELRYRNREITRKTIAYLCRRYWRYLRRIAQSLPAYYADAAVDVLRWYPPNANFRSTWIANHIFYHQLKNYSRSTFGYVRDRDLVKNRAFAELWKRTPRPLFDLLERAKAEQVREFAINSLKKDFRTALREVEAVWVVRLINVRSSAIDNFVVWLLKNVPKFEQSSFRDLGLHEPVLQLLESGSNDAKQYAVDYARAHARDLSWEKLLSFVDSRYSPVSKMALDLIQDRDPRKDVGLDAWGALLETRNGFELAQKILVKHFGAKELTPEWFKERVFSEHGLLFTSKNLLQIHSLKTLKPEYFIEIFEDERAEYEVMDFAMEKLERYPLNDIHSEFFKGALLHPDSSDTVRDWIEEEKLDVAVLGADFLKTLAYQPAWENSQWLQNLKETKKHWREHLEFDDTLAEEARKWLSDVRKFKASDLGFDWLMELVKRSEKHYHEFAVEYMTKAFIPADFATQEQQSEAPKKVSKKAEKKIDIDLQQKTFLFTGKLQTMTRSEAQKKVADAKGKKASGVNAKLDYLVIGDEGSPLYGQGKKGSKQLKAEELNNSGSNITIISETAFLQMLSGKQAEVSEDKTIEGCEKIWGMMTNAKSEDDPLALFAIRYLQRHHKDISLELTDRPVDPGAEIPSTFLTFERVKSLFNHSQKKIRKLALQFARWDLAKWDPKIEEIAQVCELPHKSVKQFFAKALLAKDEKEHSRYRIAPEKITAEVAYRFCESLDEDTRSLGMKLIDRDPKLAVPEELFRLTESPDRKVLAFVISTLWSLYRDRGITYTWRPFVPKDKQNTEVVDLNYPKNLPATHESLCEFLRRILFRIPPAKFPKDKQDSELKYLPNRRVKLNILEVMRDIALSNQPFAELTYPLLCEFLGSQGQSEQAACMVALARIGKKYPNLNTWREDLA